MGGDALGGDAQGVDERAQRRPFVGDRGVVAFHHRERAHRLPRHRGLAGDTPIMFGATRIRHRAGGVVLQRAEHHVGAGAQVLGRQGAERPRDGAERLVVGAGFPRRVDGRAERVHVGMHVGARQVGLLVPGGRGQHDIRQQRRRRHPEVDRHQQVELALRDVVGPGDVVGPQCLRGRLRLQVRGGAQQVPQEVLVALARRAEQVGPPDVQHPRPVRRVVGIGDGELQGARGELFGYVGRDLAPGGAGLVGDVEAGPVELRIERGPAHRHRGGQHVHRVLAGEPAAAQRAGQRVGPVAVVAPLVGVGVPVGGAGHLTRRARPVGGHRHRGPPGDRTALLLTDVVRPAAAVAAHRPGEQQQGQHRPVGGVAVEPLADAGAHDDHRPAAGLLGVAREFPCDTDGLRRGNPGDRLLPGRGVGLAGVVVAGGPVPRQPGSGHPVLGEHQVEHRAAPGARRPGAPARPGPGSRRARRRCRSAATQPARSPRHRRLPRTVSAGDQVAEIQVPLAHAVVAVAEPERPVRHGDRVGGPVEQHRLERRVLDVVAEIGCGEVLSGHQRAVALLELHQERQVGVASARSRRRTGTRLRTKHSERMTWPIAIASAPSVPAAHGIHSSANLVLSA